MRMLVSDQAPSYAEISETLKIPIGRLPVS
jgi:hypothetical protein